MIIYYNLILCNNAYFYLRSGSSVGPSKEIDSFEVRKFLFADDGPHQQAVEQPIPSHLVKYLNEILDFQTGPWRASTTGGWST